MKLRSLVINVGLALTYAFMYWRCYVSFLYAELASAGYDLFARERSFIVLSMVITVLPVVFYRGVRAVSSVMAVLVYLVLYVPIILTFAFGSTRPPSAIVSIQLTFMAGMVLLFLADAIVIRNPFKLELSIDLMPVVLVTVVLSTVYILFVYRGSLQFSSFGADLYEQRDANSGLGAGLLMRYLSSWLSTVLVPLCLAFGLSARKHRYTIAGSAACLVLYMAMANKVSILLPFVCLAFCLLLRGRMASVLPLLTGTLSAVVAILLAVAHWSTVAFVAAAIVLHRTIGNGGQSAVAYDDFFSFHPRTNYAHVHGLSLFAPPYPYGDLGVGQVIGQFYWTPFQNSNASFWVTDGIAALGLPGVAVISVIAALVFVAVNSATERSDRLFAVLCFLPFVMTLLNQSLFSAFWSGGGFFLILFFAVDRRGAAVTDEYARHGLVAAPA